MAEKIVFETEVKTGNSGTSIKSVKRELTELKGLMSSLDMESEEFTRAATKAAKLKDQINDANDAMRNFDPGARFTTFTTVLGGVANGFSAAQGAMAIFGGESEELEKVMVRTQGAIALATGLNGLQGMWGQLTIVANVIKTQVVAAFATMRAAIMSTGIIALVAVIGTLIYSWMQEKEANEEATKELERFGEAQRKLLDQEQKIQIAREKGRNKEILQASAETQAKIREYQKELSEKIITQEEFSKLLAGEQELMRIKVADINKKYDEEEQKQREEAAKKEKERREKLAADQDKKDKELLDKEEEAFKRSEEIQKEKNDKIIKDREDAFKNEVKLIEEQNFAKRLALANEFAAGTITKEQYDQTLIDLEKKKNTEIVAAGQKNYQDVTAQSKALSEAEIENVIKTAEAVKKTEEEKTKAKLDALNMTSASLNQFAELAGRETAAGKALAVAQATIDTYVSAGSAYAAAAKIDPIVLAPLAAAGAVAAGLARVKAIVSVKVPGGNNSAPPSAAAQSVPQFNPAVAQQVQGGGDVQLGMKPQKVYVVESDIRGTMNKVDVIEANATIG
jgi:hypothetical protein